MEILSIILSALALSFSLYIFFAHDRRLKKQEDLLNKISLKEAEEREQNRKKAKINGYIVYNGKGSNDLFISNKGEAEARNVKVDVLDDSDVGCDWTDKERYIKLLTPSNTYRFHFNTIEGASNEIYFRYCWEDNFSRLNEVREILQRR